MPTDKSTEVPTRVKLGRNWTACFADAEKASESLPPGFRGIATILRTCLYKADDEVRRFARYLDAEWNTKDPKLGNLHKPWVALKYVTLLAVGALACVPGYSAAIGFVSGILTGVVSANRKSAGLIKTAVAAIFGGYVGLQVGWIPVVGPGMACGVVKGAIEGVQDTWNTSPDSARKNWWGQFRAFNDNFFDSVGIIAQRIGLGALKGLIPVLGFALVEAKLGRKSEKDLKQRGGEIAASGRPAAGAEIGDTLKAQAAHLTPTVATARTADKPAHPPAAKSAVRKL